MMLSARAAALALMASGSAVTVYLIAGCDTIARSQGKSPVAMAFGSTAIGPEGNPLDPDLFVYKLDANGTRSTSEKVPLVKVAYRSPWNGELINASKAATNWSEQSYNMVIDVTNMMKDPTLGSADPSDFKRRLREIAEMLVIAGDWNGDVYWRHLTTFLETYKAAHSASRAALGAAIAATFISPVLGASLAGGALVIDTFVSDFTDGLNVEEYAALREASSTYRKKIKGEMFEAIDKASPGANAVDGVLHQAYDYAFTYSIKGAVHAAAKENSELKNLLVTGDSPWKRFFQDEILEHHKQLAREGKVTGDEKAKLDALIQEEDAKAKKDRDHEAALDEQRRTTELENAKRRTAVARAKRVKTEGTLRKQQGGAGVKPPAERAAMTGPEIESRVIKIVSQQLGVDAVKITRATNFVNDLNADSLDLVELTMEFEDQFEIDIPDEQADKIKTVGQAIDFIKQALTTK